MKIGIISDTHDQVERIKSAVQAFADENVEMVIHLGDIVSPFTLELYKPLRVPIKFLFGNNKGDVMRHISFARDFGLDATFAEFYSLSIDGKRIAAYHGDEPEIRDALIRCGDYDCVFTGHDHNARIERIGKVLHLNPGTLVEIGGKRPSVGIYGTETDEAILIPIEEEDDA
jgi:uncharacterized protein